MPSEMRIDLRHGATVLPEGTYEVEVEDVTLKESSGGSNYLNMRLRVIQGDHEDSVLWCIGSLREDMRWALRQTLRALGIDADDLTIQTEDGDQGEQFVVKPDLIGKEAQAQVVHSKYMGESRPKVKRLIPLD